jgi:phosphatidate cytidylyltransferase
LRYSSNLNRARRYALSFMNLSATQADIAHLFGGVIGVLSLATMVGVFLKSRIKSGTPHPTIENLNDRINAWWLIIAFIGLGLILGHLGIILLFALASFLALREFYTVAPTRPSDHKSLLFAFLVALPAQYVFVWMQWHEMFTIFIPVIAFLLLPIVSTLSGDTKHFMQRVTSIQWGLMVTVYCVAHVPALLILDIPGYAGRNVLLFGYFILIVQSSDILQFIWGKLIGRKKIAPLLSPSKTIEGTIGGILSAAALGAALWWVTPFSPGQAFGMAFVAATMGFLGGLVMSALKRDRGIKDWGVLIKGHGGMLDRLDSVCFAAPVFFYLTRYGWGA